MDTDKADVEKNIFTAIREGSEEDVRRLLDNGIDVNVKKCLSFGNTPLMVAVACRNADIAKLLIERGANINALVGTKTILYHAVNKGNKDMIQLLLENGAEIGALKVKNRSPTRPIILDAIETKDEEIVKMIFKFGADIKTNNRGESLLHFAVQKGTEKIVELLLDLGADVFAKYWNKTPLLLAIDSKNEKMVEILLNHEAKVATDASQNESETVLHTVIQSGNVKIAQLILNHGVFAFDFETRHYGKTTLLSALSSGNVQEEMIQLLLDCGANVLATTFCSEEECFDISDDSFCFEYDFDRLLGENQTTTLHYAAKCGNERVFKIILDRGLNPLAENLSRKTTLHFAVEGGNENIVNYLLEQGANIHAKDDFGETTLHHAVLAGNEKMVQFVLDNGVHIDSKNNKGQTPLHLACKQGLDCIIKVLLKYNPNLYASYQICDYTGYLQKPLNLAIMSQNNKKCVKILLDHGINVNDGIENDDYATPLESALHVLAFNKENFSFGNHKLMKKTNLEELLVYGADVADNIQRKNTKKYDELGGVSYAYRMELLTSYAKNVNAQDFLQYLRGTVSDVSDDRFRLWKEKMAKPIIQLLVLLEIDFVEVIRDYDVLKKFKVQCEQEVEKLKSKFFEQSTVSYYNFMVTKDQNQLAWYLRNNNILKVFTSGEFEAAFPIYALTLKITFRKGMWRKLMLDRVKRFFYAVADSEGNEGLPKLPFNCVSFILEQLSNKDLRMLIQVCDPINGFNIDIDV